ncbi:MAG: TlpA family protein disulfide reductase [Chloroflexi bacterium CFX4]|nr:TlpA family protein disulfide reductase [Chloroflexi bacterium CFX4]MDL1922829.1 TlpA family protein disulfide reductase [Chloroflexi bacterium CFX3]
MSEQIHDNPPERPPYPPYRPTLAIFLIMPIAAALVAFLLAESIVEGRDQIGGRRDDSPPIVALTPFTLIGSPAPDFELPTPNGETLRLSALRGQWVVVNFWATWCAPCRAEMPVLQALIDSPSEAARALGQVALIAVNRDESESAVRAFLDELNLTLPVALDAGGKISNRYGIVSLPITFFIDPEGIVRHKQIGEVTAAILEQTLRKLADP